MFKTPTCLLLNAKQELDSFGYEAEKKFTELELNGKKPDDWFFFKHFKMNLYRREVSGIANVSFLSYVLMRNSKAVQNSFYCSKINLEY